MNNCVTALCGILATISLGTFPAPAQSTPLKLGTINPNTITQLSSCPLGFFGEMTCYKGSVQACPGAADLGFTYGVEDPKRTSVGTIVFLEGEGGTLAYTYPKYAQTYLEKGFQVVYLAWDTDWEFSNGKTGTNIKYAACRPATFLLYVRTNVYTNGGMCVQGASAGSAAVAYSLVWYGSGSYLDNVELLSGPVFSDIEKGCIVPHAATVNVCAAGQFGCNGDPWPDDPGYDTPDQFMVGQWSGWPSCNNGQKTSETADSSWKQMSIVDGTVNGSFNYPQTSMAGWLCSNVDKLQNNSSAQGEYFYQQFTSSAQTAGYSVTRIDHCEGVEGVTQGRTPQGEYGFDAISNDMLAACVNRH